MKEAPKRFLNECGATLVEIIVVVAILGFFAVALSGFLHAIMVVGRNLPTSGQVQTYQQVVDQINIFLINLSRDAREAKKLEVKSGLGCPDPECSECLLVHRDEGAFITYGYWENEKAVKREGEVMIKEVYRGDSPIFQVTNDSSVTVTLPVRCLSQTKRGDDAWETRVFSFTVERRLSPLSSP
jgi:hypothetical protein